MPNTGNYGIKISNQNVDVNLANSRTLTFQSAFPLFKFQNTIRGGGILTTEAYGSGSIHLPHYFNYDPFAMIFFERKENNNRRLVGGPYIEDGPLDDETLVIQRTRMAGSQQTEEEKKRVTLDYYELDGESGHTYHYSYFIFKDDRFID